MSKLLDANNLTDAELALWIRTAVSDLNEASAIAHKRELMVKYDVYGPSLGRVAPKIHVMVVTEVA